MKWYAVAYAHVVRLEKAERPAEAAREAFGLCDPERMTVLPMPGNPKYMTNKAKKVFFESLEKRHFEKTGNTIK